MCIKLLIIQLINIPNATYTATHHKIDAIKISLSIYSLSIYSLSIYIIIAYKIANHYGYLYLT